MQNICYLISYDCLQISMYFSLSTGHLPYYLILYDCLQISMYFSLSAEHLNPTKVTPGYLNTMQMN